MDFHYEDIVPWGDRLKNIWVCLSSPRTIWRGTSLMSAAVQRRSMP